MVLLIIKLLLLQEIVEPPSPFLGGSFFHELLYGAEQKNIGHDTEQDRQKYGQGIPGADSAFCMALDEENGDHQQDGLGKGKEQVIMQNI